MKNIGTPVPPRFFCLEQDYGLNYLHVNSKVKDLFNVGEEETALPWAWKVATGKLFKLSRDTFRELNYFTACMLDAAYNGESAANLDSGFLNTYNRVGIPNGRFTTNMNIPFPRGGFDGTGNFAYYGGGSDQGHYTTEVMLSSTWIDIFPEIIALHTPNWDVANDFSYNEGYEVTRIRITGPKVFDKRPRIGIAFGRSGEGSRWDLIKVDYCDYGIVAKAGVPMSGGTCSVFGNRIAGFAGRGTAQASLRIDVISGDRNGSLTKLEPAYGQNSGGNLDIGLAKVEDANPQGGGEFGDQIVGYYAGQFHVTIANVRHSCDQRKNDALFVVNPIIEGHEDWGMQGSFIRATGSGYGYNTLLHNVLDKTRIPAEIENRSWVLDWFAIGAPIPGQLPAGDKALGSLPKDPNTGQAIGTWDYIKGTPARKDVLSGGPVTPPVDPPIDPPVPSDSYTGGPWTVDTSTFYVPVNVRGVTKAVITLTPSDLAYGRILGSGNSKPSLQLYPDGYLYWDGKKVSTSPFTKNKKKTVTVNIPATTITGLFQTDKDQGGAQQGKFDKITLSGGK